MSKIVEFLKTEEKTTRGKQLLVCGCLFGLWALNQSLINEGARLRRKINNYKEINKDLGRELEWEEEYKLRLIEELKESEMDNKED